jgi:DNA-directed RNA polymerase subunit E'/Rpb7
MQRNSIFCHKRLQSCLCLYAHQLHHNWKQEILSSLVDIWTGHCEKDIGYISNVILPSVRVISQSVIEEGVVRFHVEFDVTTILPYVGSILTGTIQMVTSYGIFVSYNDYLRLMIPIHLLPSHFVFQKQFSSNVYFDTKTNRPLQLHDSISVQIIEFRFEENHFSCIALYLSKQDPSPSSSSSFLSTITNQKDLQNLKKVSNSIKV